MSTQSDAKQEYLVVDLTKKRTNPNLAPLVPMNLLEDCNAVCISKRGNVITVAFANQTQTRVKEDIQILLECGKTRVVFCLADFLQVIVFRKKQVAAWKKQNPGKKIDGLNLPDEAEGKAISQKADLKLCSDADGIPYFKCNKAGDTAQTDDGFVDTCPGFESKTGEKLQHNPDTKMLRRVDKSGQAHEPFGTFTSLPRPENQSAEEKMVRVANILITEAIKVQATEVFFSTHKHNVTISYKKNGRVLENGPAKLVIPLPWFAFKPLVNRFKNMVGIEQIVGYARGSYVARYNAKNYQLDFEFLPTQGSEVCVIKIQYEKQDDLLAKMNDTHKKLLMQKMSKPGVILCSSCSPGMAKEIMLAVCNHFVPEGAHGALIGTAPYGLNSSNISVVDANNYATLANAIENWATVASFLAINTHLDHDAMVSVLMYSHYIPIIIWGTYKEEIEKGSIAGANKIPILYLLARDNTLVVAGLYE